MNGSRPPRTPSSTRRRRDTAAAQTLSAVRFAGPFVRKRSSALSATRRRSSSDASPSRVRAIPSCANTSATSRSVRARPVSTRSERSSDSSMRRGTSVSSAMSNPGSRSASSGNSRRSERQNASMVLIAMSPSRSRSSCHCARSISDRSAADASSWRMRSRISAAALRVKVIARMFDGSMPRFRRLT